MIIAERPDGLLATLGGQTGLNLAVALDDAGVLERHNVRVLGTGLRAIRTAEDRERFKELLAVDRGAGARVGDRGVACGGAGRCASAWGCRWWCVRHSRSAERAVACARPMSATRRRCLPGSPRRRSARCSSSARWPGWREIEYEVIRDASGTCITVCNMENLDPMGVHTGDSMVVAPAQTLTDREHQQLRSAALRIINALDIQGGCNVQFALAPDSHEYHVIEVNPRVSRSSALASKATGYPIARVAAKIAAGRRLDEIPNAVTGKTCAAFEPALDYCVVKIPRWPFDKFPEADRRLGTQMKSTGEVMAIERSFEAAFSKALRSLEQPQPDPAVLHEPVLIDVANDRRAAALLEALRGGATPEELTRRSGIAAWFLRRLGTIVACEERLRWNGLDGRSAPRRKTRRPHRCAYRSTHGCRSRKPFVRDVGTQGYNRCSSASTRAPPSSRRRRRITTRRTRPRTRDAAAAAPAPNTVVVLGSGPIRIGQGIEFDYCSVHAAMALRAQGVDAVMVNSNPETVSTDFDCSTRLYFEPLDEEAVHRDHRRGAGVWRRRPVRWSDGDQPRRAARPCGRHHPRQQHREHRPCRGSPRIRGVDALAVDRATAGRGDDRSRRGACDRGRHRLPGPGATVLRARGTGDGDRAQPRPAAAISRGGDGCAPGRGRPSPRHRAHRSIPVRHRGRRRRHQRRRHGGDSGADGARRARGRAQRRLDGSVPGADSR